MPRHDNHHDLAHQGVERIASEEKSVGGQLGRPSGARFRTYERLKRYADEVRGTLFDLPELRRAIEDIYNSAVVICHAGTRMLPLDRAENPDKGVCDGIANYCASSRGHRARRGLPRPL
jgi:hypothetical protein